MNLEIKKKWVEALRSGKYKQGESRLNPGHTSFCCLGVLADLQGWPLWAIDLNYGQRNSVGLPEGEMAKLINMNDGTNGVLKADFEQIANYIEEVL